MVAETERLREELERGEPSHGGDPHGFSVNILSVPYEELFTVQTEALQERAGGADGLARPRAQLQLRVNFVTVSLSLLSMIMSPEMIRRLLSGGAASAARDRTLSWRPRRRRPGTAPRVPHGVLR